MKKLDLTGQRFGRLTALERVESLNGHSRWLCQCDCGKTTIVHQTSLKNGNTKSCGCLRIEMIKENFSTSCSKDKVLYMVWNGIKQRCNNPNNASYYNYGGRGITICDEWLDYENFYEWAMNNGYKHGLEIDRINNSLGYDPENCQWVTKEVNANNKRNVKLYEINGQSKSLAQWCKDYNMEYSLVRQRVYKLGWNIEKALTIPAKIYNR